MSRRLRHLCSRKNRIRGRNLHPKRINSQKQFSNIRKTAVYDHGVKIIVEDPLTARANALELSFSEPIQLVSPMRM